MNHEQMKLMKISLSLWLIVIVGIPGYTWRVEGATWKWEGEGSAVEIDTARTGQILRWHVDGRTLAHNDDSPLAPLRIELDGEQDTLDFVVRGAESPAPHILCLRGELMNRNFRLPMVLQYQIEAEGRKIRVNIEPEQKSSNMGDIAAFTWSLSLQLNPRKRIYFLGDHGFEWETRYFYQFMVNSAGNLLPQADRNEWRFFSLDQLGTDAFRLWKAESSETSPLLMQEGKVTAPGVQIYDQSGGVSLLYPGLSESAPKSLCVDAAGGGEISVQFWSRLHLPAQSDRPGVLGAHEIILEGFSQESDLIEQRKDWLKKYPGTSRPTPESVLEESTWVRSTPMEENVVQYTSGGYPFSQGEVFDVRNLQVRVAGRWVPVQSKALAFWPDRSVKWALLVFPIDVTLALSECPPPRISLHDGRFLPVEVSVMDSATTIPPQQVVRVEQSRADSILIQNGEFEIEFGTGQDWLSLSHLRKGERHKLGNLQGYINYSLRPGTASVPERTVTNGEIDAGLWRVTDLKVEESGPLRVVVRLEGLTDNQEATRIIARVEILAGRPELRITYSSEFLFKDPRQTFLNGMGIRISLPSEALKAAKFGGLRKEIQADQQEEALFLQFTPRYSELLQKHANRWQAQAGKGRAPGWVEVKGETFHVVAAMRNFWQQAPSALGVNFRKGKLDLGIWPEKAGNMDVRRYSNFPHYAQGEAVSPNDNWVKRRYYADDPFVGISRTREILVGFWPEAHVHHPQDIAADFQSPPLLYAGWDRYEKTGVVLPSASASTWPRAWEAWNRLTHFWLYHQALHGWHGFWNYGDIRHLFQNGYGWILPPQSLIDMRQQMNSGSLLPSQVRRRRVRDYHPPNDWAYDNGRWGWSNTEGLPNLFFQHEYLRHGNRAVYFASEALARHSRDVIIRHDGKWFGRGTRHGVQPWSDGNHEERQTTSTEYRLHYFLSGDGRSRDVIQKLFDRYYSKTSVHVDAGHSGRLGGLLFHWELTADPSEAEQLKNYVNAFISPEGIYTAPQVQFPGPKQTGAPQELNSNRMFFYTFGGMHALLEYHQITGDPALKDALIKMADAAISEEDSLRYFWPAVAFAALQADNPAPYRDFLQKFLIAEGWQHAYQPVTQNTQHWSGPTARLHGGVPMSFFWTNWAPYVLSATSQEELWTKEMTQRFEWTEKNGNPVRKLPLSWQSEFDGHPELEDYLGYQQPWTAVGVSGSSTSTP